MDILKSEVARNITGYFLVISGIFCIVYGGHTSNAVLIDTGKGLVGASLLAFQMKRSPDGNTTTTSVTVPPPLVAEPIAGPKS